MTHRPGPLPSPGPAVPCSSGAASPVLTIDCGILAVVIISHSSLGHGTPHRLAGLGDGVAAQVHHVLRAPAGDSAPCSCTSPRGQACPTPPCPAPNQTPQRWLCKAGLLQYLLWEGPVQPIQAVLSPAVTPSLLPAACTHPRATLPHTGHASPLTPVPPFTLLPRRGPGPCSQARRSAAPAPCTASIARTVGTAGTAPPQGLPGRVVRAGTGRPAPLPAAQPAALPGGAAAWGAA